MMWNEDLIPAVKLFGRNSVEMEVIGKRYRKADNNKKILRKKQISTSMLNKNEECKALILIFSHI